MMAKSLWWLMLVCSTTRQKQNIVCMKGNVLLLFGLFYHFDVIFMVVPFTLITKRQPLKVLMESNCLTRKFIRWALIIQEYNFNIIH